MIPAVPTLSAIGTATPDRDIHELFVGWAAERLPARERRLFERMADRSAIGHRWSVLDRAPLEAGGLYADGAPPTSERMTLYAEHAPGLAESAVQVLDGFDPAEITHLVVASCTGFVAPGLDQLLAAQLGLGRHVERLLVGFMGCYAAVVALRQAATIVRADPHAVVLVVTCELSTLHLQETTDLDALLAMLHFGDGAAAAVVRDGGPGLRLGKGLSVALPDSEALIQWRVGDTGFAMILSGEVPGRLRDVLAEPEIRRALTDGRDPADLIWAVHAGGRSVLDAVEGALGLDPAALAASRAVLERFGNMSSSTLMFTLADLLTNGPEGPGVALAFGPGLAAEGVRFEIAR